MTKNTKKYYGPLFGIAVYEITRPHILIYAESALSIMTRKRLASNPSKQPVCVFNIALSLCISGRDLDCSIRWNTKYLIILWSYAYACHGVFMQEESDISYGFNQHRFFIYEYIARPVSTRGNCFCGFYSINITITYQYHSVKLMQ